MCGNCAMAASLPVEAEYCSTCSASHGTATTVSAPTTDLDSSAPSPKKSSDGRMTHAERDAERENMESFQGRYARNFTSAKADGLSACFPHYSDAEKMRMEILRATMT